jgi:phosphoserine phosphatase
MLDDILSDAELTDAIVAELCTGRQLLKVREEEMEREARRNARLDRGHKTLPGLGKKVFTWHQDQFFAMMQDPRFGLDALHDKGFMREMQKREPDLKGFSL